ncbi:MAG: hypothetical protein PHV17_09980 [Candidatus Omnitrophica bacterium]|nr:hypothetical protein [Candidatus Omnitrophota bacterium]
MLNKKLINLFGYWLDISVGYIAGTFFFMLWQKDSVINLSLFQAPYLGVLAIGQMFVLSIIGLIGGLYESVVTVKMLLRNYSDGKQLLVHTILSLKIPIIYFLSFGFFIYFLLGTSKSVVNRKKLVCAHLFLILLSLVSAFYFANGFAINP